MYQEEYKRWLEADLEDADLVIYLRKKLNRPMRVCGMVKNVGEPGGGPFSFLRK